MANEQNLKPFTSDQNREEAKKNGAKGGRASGEARRRKKTMRENLELILSMPLKNGKSDNIEDAEDLQSFSGANMTVEQALIMAQVKKAAKGDLNAFEAIRDLIGEKVTKSEVSVQSNNPFEGLSTEELKKLIDDDKE